MRGRAARATASADLDVRPPVRARRKADDAAVLRPGLRSTRVRRRVSMLGDGHRAFARRYSASVTVARKLDTRSGRSLMTRPAAWTLVDSTSSSLTP